MKNEITSLSREEFDRFSVSYPANVVIVEMPPERELTTKGGIKINFNPEVQYGTLDGEDTSSHVADCADIYGKVVKQPDRLYYNRKDIMKSMSWECEVDTLVGDVVWFHPLISMNCSEVQVDNILYKVVPYEDLFVARRGGMAGEVVCLNGNIIIEPSTKKKLSYLDVSDPQEDKFKGIVIYNGKDNTRYVNKGQTDTKVAIGETVILDKGCYPFFLERSKWNSTFDEGRQFIVVQKRFVLAVI